MDGHLIVDRFGDSGSIIWASSALKGMILAFLCLLRPCSTADGRLSGVWVPDCMAHDDAQQGGNPGEGQEGGSNKGGTAKRNM